MHVWQLYYKVDYDQTQTKANDQVTKIKSRRFFVFCLDTSTKGCVEIIDVNCFNQGGTNLSLSLSRDSLESNLYLFTRARYLEEEVSSQSQKVLHVLLFALHFSVTLTRD
jgi:hypothetical protein